MQRGKRLTLVGSCPPATPPHVKVSHDMVSRTDADGTRSRTAAHEPAPLRLAGGHGHDDAPQRGISAAQLAPALCSLDDLREPWAGLRAVGVGP